MQPLYEWRIKKYEEIAVSTNPDHIIRGMPTLPSIKENIWGNSPIPPNIPKTSESPVANGEVPYPEEKTQDQPNYKDETAPSINNGGMVKNLKWIEFLQKKDTQRGLGNKGMGHLSSSTFKNIPVPAGETPTISHGVPVSDEIPF